MRFQTEPSKSRQYTIEGSLRFYLDGDDLVLVNGSTEKRITIPPGVDYEGWGSSHPGCSYPYTYMRFSNRYRAYVVDGELELWHGSRYGDYMTEREDGAIFIATTDNKKAPLLHGALTIVGGLIKDRGTGRSGSRGR